MKKSVLFQNLRVGNKTMIHTATKPLLHPGSLNLLLPQRHHLMLRRMPTSKKNTLEVLEANQCRSGYLSTHHKCLFCASKDILYKIKSKTLKTLFICPVAQRQLVGHGHWVQFWLRKYTLSPFFFDHCQHGCLGFLNLGHLEWKSQDNCTLTNSSKTNFGPDWSLASILWVPIDSDLSYKFTSDSRIQSKYACSGCHLITCSSN